MNNTTFELILSSGITVAIITGIFNWRELKENSRILKSIEESKYKNEVTKYRYIKLHELLTEIVSFEAVKYNISDTRSTTKTVEEITHRYHNVVGKYIIAKSLIDNKYLSRVEEALRNEEIMSNLMVKSIYGNEILDFELKDLLEKRLEFENAFINAIQSQVQDLIN